MGKETPESATTTLKVGPPKFQTTIPEEVREIFEIDDLERGEKAILEAEIRLKKIK
jgi:bifunctional DNA-binding transcriptional regulator/antitoxin component of YhaV-PrlF toxin-antitoxin module